MVLRKSVHLCSFPQFSNLITEEIIMFKKFMSLVLALMIVMSVAAVSFSAAQVEIADEAAEADDVASQGAEADVAATGEGLVYFDAASAGWESASSILFYISDIENGELAAWGSKKKLGGTKGDNDIWSFDAQGLGVEDGHVYIIIFNNYDTSAETYQLLMDTSCFGDTAKANPSVMIENPVDSNKSSMEARWTNSSLGPRLQISSIGSIVGESIPANTTAYKMLVQFLASKGNDGLQNALNFNGKDEQTTIDEVAGKLGLTKSDVKNAIEEAKTTGDGADWSGKWDASKSSLPGGDDDGGGSSSGGSSSGSSSGTSSGTSSGGTSTSGGSSTTTKSGSASNTQTGQEETVLFIMLGVMVAAAGVIFFARKRERA